MALMKSELPTVEAHKKARFDRICIETMRMSPIFGEGGIGTLGEKRLHAIIKRYLCEDETLHEVGLAGTRFVSDIRIGNDIYEVQTGAFYPMRKKIAYYLSHTDCKITVVHPIAVTRYISWVDPDTHEISPRKRSPKREAAFDLLPELFALSEHLQSPRLCFRLLFIEVQDFRLLNGWSNDRKRGSNRFERFPLELLGEAEFDSPAAFQGLIPNTLPERFTVKEFSAATKLRGRKAYSAVHALAAMGLIEEKEKRGRSMTFQVVGRV